MTRFLVRYFAFICTGISSFARRVAAICVASMLFVLSVCAQKYQQTHRVLFYNCENLFDPSDNPQTKDDDFTPRGIRHWTFDRQYRKLISIAQVVAKVGEGSPPCLIGLAEVENDSVIEALLHRTPLWHWQYEYVITQSADVRGINVALLYQPLNFRLLGWAGLRVQVPAGSKPTRDLLHAWGRLVGGDTLDVVVCHLPSRRGGLRKSAPVRAAAHRCIRHLADSLRAVRSRPHLLVMGDMNDAPNTKALCQNMRFGEGLSNLMQPLQQQLRQGLLAYGTYKYRGEWDFLDQFWVNDGLKQPEAVNKQSNKQNLQPNLSSHGTVSVWVDSIRSVCFPFMLKEDATHMGHRPWCSYHGYRYEGGFSDHLPICLDLHISYK